MRPPGYVRPETPDPIATRMALRRAQTAREVVKAQEWLKTRDAMPRHWRRRSHGTCAACGAPTAQCDCRR